LTDKEVLERLRGAAEDEESGRLVHCETEEDLRAFFADLRPGEG
jgi:hypothetical protein